MLHNTVTSLVTSALFFWGAIQSKVVEKPPQEQTWVTVALAA